LPASMNPTSHFMLPRVFLELVNHNLLETQKASRPTNLRALHKALWYAPSRETGLTSPNLELVHVPVVGECDF
jgi:hypothetical protein